MLRNTSFSYGWIAILLHWLVAVVVFSLFGLGLYMVDLSYYDAWYKAAPDLHRSVGLTLLAVLLCRICWRAVNPTPAPLAGWTPTERKMSSLVHKLLYVLLFATIAAGYLISTADGRSISMFGLFDIPAIFPAVKGMEDIAGEVHEMLAWAIVATVALHAAGALKHHFLDRDKTLLRILKPQSRQN